MSAPAELWPVSEPTVTGNAILMLGYVAGVMFKHGEDAYRWIAADPDLGYQTFEHVRTGNTFRMMIEQVGGVE